MSDETNTNTAVIEKPETSAKDKFTVKFQKRDYAFARVNDDQAAFTDFVNEYFDDTNPYKDWAGKAASKLGDNLTFAIVMSDNGQNRLIAIASKETALASEIVREAAYRYYLNRVLNAASKDDAEESTFESVDGCFKARFDLTAFKELARGVVKFLHGKGLKSMSVAGLKLGMSSKAYAEAQFPTMKQGQWDIIFAIFLQTAEERQLDNTVFTHWKNTRNMVSVDATAEDFTADDFFTEMAEEEAAEDTQSEPVAEIPVAETPVGATA